MRVMFAAGLLFFNLIFESTALQSMKIGGVMPNIMIMLIVCYGILRGGMEGAIFGFCAGLLEDIMFGGAIGFSALMCMYIGYLSGSMNKNFFHDNFFMPIVFCFVCTFLSECTFYTFTFLMRGRTDIGYYISHLILPEAVYTAVVSIIVYRLLYVINLRIEKVEYKRRKLF